MSIYDTKTTSPYKAQFTPKDRSTGNWLTKIGNANKFSAYTGYSGNPTAGVHNAVKQWRFAPEGAGMGMDRNYANAMRWYMGENPTWVTQDLKDRVDQLTQSAGRRFSQEQIDAISRDAARLGTSGQPGVNAAKEQARYNNAMQVANNINQNKVVFAQTAFDNVRQSYAPIQQDLDNLRQLQLAQQELNTQANLANKQMDAAKQQSAMQMGLGILGALGGGLLGGIGSALGGAAMGAMGAGSTVKPG